MRDIQLHDLPKFPKRMAHHYLDKSITYNRWDRSYEPRLRIDSGDTVTIEMNDVSDGQLTKDSTAVDWEKDKMKVHGLRGLSKYGERPKRRSEK